MESTLNLEMRRTTLLRSAENLTDAAIRENRAMRPGEEVDYEGIMSKVDSIDRTLGRAAIFGRNSGEPGAVFTRVVMALTGAKGDMRAALERAGVSRDHEVTRALSASISSQGGYAVPMGYSADIIQALRPLVAVRKLNPTIVPMTKGNLTWPRLSTGATASYLGENAVVQQSQTEAFAALNLVARKLAAFIPVSNDFMRYANPAGDVIVKADMLAGLASVQDAAFINGIGTAYSPKGLLSWVLPQNQIVASALTGTDNDLVIANDLGALELALVNANVLMERPGFILHPQTVVYLKNLRNTVSGIRAFPEVDRGYLRGFPFAASTNVPIYTGTGNQTGAGLQTSIILADFVDVVIGEAEFVIDAATQSSYKDGSGATVSAFSTDQTVIRIISQQDIGMKHRESLAVLTNAPWIATAS